MDFGQKPCRYTVFWKKSQLVHRYKPHEARILKKSLEDALLFEKRSHLVHRYKPQEARFRAARFFSGTKIRVSRGLAVLHFLKLGQNFKP